MNSNWWRRTVRRVGSHDVVLAVLPFFHVFGLSSVVNVFLVRRGGCLSVLPRFVPAQVLDAMEADRVTVIGGVPTMLHALAVGWTSPAATCRRCGSRCPAASLPEDVMRTFEDKYGIEVLEGYGLTRDRGLVLVQPAGREEGAVDSKPMWGVRMCSSANLFGETLPAGRDHVGEIHIMGHNVMKGYLGRPEATAETLIDGWLHTGDLGYMDEDGFYFIVDRAKDLVIRGGYNVYPREIEENLYAHPAVHEAAVIGKPDERLGEEVVAVVALGLGRLGDRRGTDLLHQGTAGRVQVTRWARSASWTRRRAPPARSSRPHCGTSYRLRHWGSRFWAKARTPSRESSLAIRSSRPGLGSRRPRSRRGCRGSPP